MLLMIQGNKHWSSTAAQKEICAGRPTCGLRKQKDTEDDCQDLHGGKQDVDAPLHAAQHCEEALPDDAAVKQRNKHSHPLPQAARLKRLNL